jgi:putative molybdopterin biosynthesis protein
VHLNLTPFEAETVSLPSAHQRVLAADLRAPVDVPAFDRSNVDGFAVRAEDTFCASESQPIELDLQPVPIAAGMGQLREVRPLQAIAVATGAVVPRGASAVVMIEHTLVKGGRLVVNSPIPPGANVKKSK